MKNSDTTSITVFTCLFLLFPTNLYGQQTSPVCSEQNSEMQSESGRERIYTAKEVTLKAVIRKQPNPSYTKKAEQNNVEGTVVLRAVLAANKKVSCIEVIKGLPDGLTEKAVEAAKKIKFDPAVKDGKPVSQWAWVEYNFNVY